MAESITITQGTVEGMVRDAVSVAVDCKADDVIRRHVEEALTERIRALTDERLSAEFEAVLAEGWRKTNTYGEPTGETVTLRSFVLGHLKGDGFRNPVDSIFKEQVDKALKGELGELIKQATEKLRGMLDATIAEKLRNVLAEAVKTR